MIRLLLLGLRELVLSWESRGGSKLLLLLGPMRLFSKFVVFYITVLGLLDSLERGCVCHHAEALAFVLLELLLVAHLTLERALCLRQGFPGVSATMVKDCLG